LIIISCKENKKPESSNLTIESEILEPKVNFYSLILDHKTEQELSNKFQLDSSKYFENFILQGRSKTIERNLEDVKSSDFLNETEIEKLNYHEVFENYESDFINMYEFNSKKHETNKTEIVYFFTYPFTVSKEKVLIGFEVKHKSHPIELTKGGAMGFFVLEKINNSWKLTTEEFLMEY
jgi:hypothetical protein